MPGKKPNSSVSVILVEPVYGGNVGAIARIMNNFCFSDLRIVGKAPEKNDFYLAMHSEAILENARLFDSLAEATQGLDRIIAFSRRLGKQKPIDLSPPAMAEYVHKLPNLKIGLVFGRETFGLTDAEADLCPLRCHYSANPAFPSINLAQAVALALYEIDSFKARGGSLEPVEDAQGGQELDNLYNYMMEVLESIGYFKRPESINWEVFLHKMLVQLNPNPEMIHRFRQMFNRIHVLVTGRGKGF